MEKNIVKNDLFDYENRYIYQLENGFKFSLDSILLSEYVTLENENSLVVDFCSGLAPLPLILSTKYKNKIKAIEIQKNIYDLAKQSVKLNKLENQIEVINIDIKNSETIFSKKSIDVITCNPPYFKFNENSLINEDEIKKISRHEFMITLEEIFSISSKLLSDNGKLYMVHRPERLDEIMIYANKYNMNVKEVINIITNKKLGIKTILVKCVKNSKLNINIRAVDVSDVISYKNIFEVKK